MELTSLPDCPICASRPLWFTGITSHGGNDYFYTGISCPTHWKFFIGTCIEYPTNSAFPTEEIESIKEQYKYRVQAMYEDGLGLAEKSFINTMNITE